MFEFRINAINNKFENIKEEINNGKLLVYAKWEIEDLIDEARELKSLVQTNESVEELNTLLKQLNQYLYDIQSLIEKECSTTL